MEHQPQSQEPATAQASAPTKVLPDPIELVREAFNHYTGLFSKIFPVLIIMYLTSAMTIFSRFIENGLLVGIVSLVAGIISLIAYIALMRIITGVEHDPADLTANFKRATRLFIPYIWISILVIVIVSGGTVVFVIPGIILALYLFLASYIFIVEDKRGLDALAASWRYIYGRWWAVVWRMLVFLIIILCISFITTIVFSVSHERPMMGQDQNPVGVDLVLQLIQALFFLPLTVSYSYALYSALKATTVPVSEATEHRARRVFKIFGIIGAIAIPVFIVVIVGLAALVALSKGDPNAAAQTVGPLKTILNLL